MQKLIRTICYNILVMICLTTTPVKTFVAKSKIPGVDYVINPYVGCPHSCLYCYAEYMRKFSGHSEPWGEFLDVKMCNTPLRPTQLFHQTVMLSSVTDPYNPFEKKYKLTRQLLTQLIACQAYVSILTKSALVTRDIDLLKNLPQCEVALSFSTVDEKTRQQIEPRTSTVTEKIDALKTLHQAGISTAVMAAPLLPGISDWKAIVEATAPYVTHFRFDRLNMRATFRHKLMDFIDVYYPHLLTLYHEIYLREKDAYWEQLHREIENYAKAQHLSVEIFFGQGPTVSLTPVTTDEDVNFPSTDLNQPQLF